MGLLDLTSPPREPSIAPFWLDLSLERPRTAANRSINRERILQFGQDYCTYVLSFSALRGFRGGPSLFLKIVFDKGGPPAY